MSLVWMVAMQISVTMDGCGGVTGVLMSGGAPVPLPDHSSHSTDLDTEAAADTERRCCAGPEPRDCAPRSAVCLRARAPRVSAVSVQRSSFLLLVAGVASLPGQGEPLLHFIFVFLLTHSAPTNKSMTRILSKLSISRCLKA